MSTDKRTPMNGLSRYWYAVDLPADADGLDDILDDVNAGIGSCLEDWADLRDYDVSGPQEQPAADAAALDRLSEILTTGGQPWPSGADFLEWCAEIVRSTGRTAE